jgi:hypothetical protein
MFKFSRAPSDEVGKAPASFVMDRPSDHPHHVRRVVLPSGKTIEVVYFEDERAPGADREQRQCTDLHVCRGCGSGLVHPVEWEESGTAHWEVALRCPNCDWEGTGVYDQHTVDRFDEELDHGTELLVRDLKRLMHANMEDEVERFASALQAGHIVPEDF